MSKTKRPAAYSVVQVGIGARIRWARELVYPVQKECADLLGIDKGTLNKIEAGTRAPSVFNIVALSNRLRVSTDFLLKGLLTAKTDEEMAIHLAALHPELVFQLEGTGGDTGKDQIDGMPAKPRKPTNRQKPLRESDERSQGRSES